MGMDVKWAKPERLQSSSIYGLDCTPRRQKRSNKKKTKESQCKINNTWKDSFHDAAHVLGPWIDFFLFSITLRLTGEWRWKWRKKILKLFFSPFHPAHPDESEARVKRVISSSSRLHPPRTSHLHPYDCRKFPHPTNSHHGMSSVQWRSWGEGNFPNLLAVNGEGRCSRTYRIACNRAGEKQLAELWAKQESHPRRWSYRDCSRDCKSPASPYHIADVVGCWARRSWGTSRRWCCWSAMISACPPAASPSTFRLLSWHLISDCNASIWQGTFYWHRAWHRQGHRREARKLIYCCCRSTANFANDSYHFHSTSLHFTKRIIAFD